MSIAFTPSSAAAIAVSEGIHAPDGKLWAEKMQENLEKDSHGNVQLSGTGALGDFLAG